MYLANAYLPPAITRRIKLSPAPRIRDSLNVDIAQSQHGQLLNDVHYPLLDNTDIVANIDGSGSLLEVVESLRDSALIPC